MCNHNYCGLSKESGEFRIENEVIIGHESKSPESVTWENKWEGNFVHIWPGVTPGAGWRQSLSAVISKVAATSLTGSNTKLVAR